jgi:hypothetical protein
MHFRRHAVVLAWALVLGCIAAAALGNAQDDAGGSIWLRLMVLSSPEDAQELAEQLRGGADFAALARARSIDATSVDGGFMGKVDIGTLRQELREALQGLKPGQVTKTVKIPSGYAIMKVLPTPPETSQTAADRSRQAAVGATGSVRYLLDVDGLIEAYAKLMEIPKRDGWEQSPQAICEVHTDAYAASKNFLNTVIRIAADRSAQGIADPDPTRTMQAHYALGQVLAYSGDLTEAIKEWEIAGRMVAASAPQMNLLLEETLGIAYLHKSEMDNDVYRNPGDRCLFPMRDLHYAQPADSKIAIAHFLKYLEQRPDEVDVKWLLNIAAMTVGDYPNGIPQKFRIPPEVFKSAEPAPHFTDVATETGLNVFAMASGVVVNDFDNDGQLDVITTNFNPCGSMHCFHNNGDGTFADRTAQAGLGNQLGGLNLVAADYNNDGCLDILVLRGAWETLGQRMSLLRNDCKGAFQDVTKESGLSTYVGNTQSAVWADIDNDGFVDLFVVNEQGPSHLYRNRGDGTFEDISKSAGIDRSAFSKGVTAADYDGDGYVDFFVSNFGASFLYHNNHDGTFTEVSREAGIATDKSFATWFFDYDNDGWPDLFITSYFTSVDETARTYLGMPHNASTLLLYRNLGDGRFQDVTKETGLHKVYMPMGSNFGDIDNDGYLDIYLGTGNPSYGSLVPNVLLRNKEGKSFVDVTAASGTGELHKGHGIAFADLDNDGDEDILEAVGGAVPGDQHVFRLFENPGSGNDWVSLQLAGTKANRSAIGAQIKLTVRNEARATRTIYRTVGSVSSFGGSPLRQHIGLGKSAEIVKLEIKWPGATVWQAFSGAGKNQFLEIQEGSPALTKINLLPYRLGGKNRN